MREKIHIDLIVCIATLFCLVLIYAKGCEDPHRGHQLVVSDDGVLREYFWVGSNKCGQVSKDHNRFVAGSWLPDGEVRDYDRREDAIAWMDRICPDAFPLIDLKAVTGKKR